MRKILLILIFIPLSISAQQHPDIYDQPDMKKMMQAMKKMQECMQKIDKTELKNIDKKYKKSQQKVQSLCAKGKKAQAKREFQKYTKKMMNNPVVKKLNQCTEIMKNLPGQTITEDNHVCDSPDENH